MDAEYSGSDLTVALTPSTCWMALRGARGRGAVGKTVDSLKPAVLRSVGNDHFLYLLMPVRVS
ncbi:MAG: hypothetical protein Ct9H300mP31_21270 [Acidimicrobiaceae bacterium]|nr:MAG: hypothetical protein Ct9H300mP31_21270 [Acidimicrobiaceae bacterium]